MSYLAIASLCAFGLAGTAGSFAWALPSGDPLRDGIKAEAWIFAACGAGFALLAWWI